MISLLAAVSTDDGKTMINRHFGDADKFLIYQITPEKAEFLKVIENTTEEENDEVHADPRKAGNIARLLKQEKVQVVVSRVFGPNLKRIKQHFVCVITNAPTVSDSIALLQKNMEKLDWEWQLGEQRSFLRFD